MVYLIIFLVLFVLCIGFGVANIIVKRALNKKRRKENEDNGRS